MEAALNARPAPLTATQWLICATAGLGFAFDMYELVVHAIILRPMLLELGPYQPGTPEFNRWAGIVLFLPTVLGGLAALGGGYLTDRLGRQRVLVWSIVLYGTAAFFAGLSTSIGEFIVWRCITVAGACVEFVAAIAWLTELFPEPKRREAVLGFSQVCATLGNFMIAGAYYVAVTWADSFPAIHGQHSAWRYALIFGALPAIPLMILRPFLPESPVWQASAGGRHVAPAPLRRAVRAATAPVTLVTTAMIACCYALAFGMLQHIPRIVPGLPQVAELARRQQEQWVSWVHLHVDTGALLGRLLFAVLAVYLVRRRPMLRTFMLVGLGLYPVRVPRVPLMHDVDLFKYAVLAVTLVVGTQYSFWGNYLPRVFPLHLRGTGESFAISFGGRVLAPVAALVTTQLANFAPGATPDHETRDLDGHRRGRVHAARARVALAAARATDRPAGGLMSTASPIYSTTREAEAGAAHGRARATLRRGRHGGAARRRVSPPGWHCLEVGGGGGTVAHWMAERCAPGGSVLCTDIDPRHIVRAPRRTCASSGTTSRRIRCRRSALRSHPRTAGAHAHSGARRPCSNAWSPRSSPADGSSSRTST